MSTLSIGHNASQLISQNQSIKVEKNTADTIQGEGKKAQDVTALANQEGMLSLMMAKQSSHSDYLVENKVASNSKRGEITNGSATESIKSPQPGLGDIHKATLKGFAGERENIPAAKHSTLSAADQGDHTKGTLKRSAEETGNISAAKNPTLSVAGEGDASKAERLAALAPALLTSPLTLTQANNKAESTKSTSESTVTGTSSSTAQVRSQPAVEGGTDITATDPSGPRFINVVGPMNQLQVSNTLTSVLLNAERDANKMAASASSRGVESAKRAGDQTIAAAKVNLNGAIASGTLGIAGQGAMAATQVKSLNKESTSITRNLKSAKQIELGVDQHKNAIKGANQTMVHQDKKLSGEVEASMSKQHAGDTYNAEILRDKHNHVQLVTQKVRLASEYGNAAVRSGQGAVEGGFGVVAAEKHKEAELARADREVNNELANTHSQMARKAAESNAAMRNMTESVLNANNSAASSIAQK